jgi:periplasmic divalent cation tolerance protein
MCGGPEEASRIANSLIEERLAACVSVLPTVESVYRWQEKIETAHETPLLIKTTHDRFPALEKRIVELHSYNTPEIVALPVVAGLEKYLRWVWEQVSSE